MNLAEPAQIEIIWRYDTSNGSSCYSKEVVEVTIHLSEPGSHIAFFCAANVNSVALLSSRMRIWFSLCWKPDRKHAQSNECCDERGLFPSSNWHIYSLTLRTSYLIYGPWFLQLNHPTWQPMIVPISQQMSTNVGKVHRQLCVLDSSRSASIP